MATKRGRVSDRVAVVVGPEAEVSVIVGLGKRTTDRLARAEYARLHRSTGALGEGKSIPPRGGR